MNTRPLFLLAAFACSTPKTSFDGSVDSPDAIDDIGDEDGSDDGNDDQQNEDDQGSDGPDDEEPQDEEPQDEEPQDEEPEDEEPEDEEPEDEEPLPDLSAFGGSEVEASSGSMTTSGGATIEFERFEPMTASTDGEVFILHGFMRSKDQFTEIAGHLASWGVATTAMTMMHSSLVDIDPEENAADVVELAEYFGAEEVVWIGHSNGGISALMASVLAPALTKAVLGLDPVEAIGGAGAEWAPEVTAPIAALVGEPDTCNSENSGLPTYLSASASRAIRVTEADHCNFESPTNWLCTLSCATTKTAFSDEAIGATITEMTTAWALGHLLADFDPRPWWTIGGTAWLELEGSGAAASL